ncbi:MAG: HNH endonuclease [Dehalobacter sp.]|nr:HNH endonuclease [Dehalobacter sp.]
MKKYSEEVKAFIERNVDGITTKALVDLVNNEFGTDFTEAKMKSYKHNHGLKSGTMCGIPAGMPTKQYPDNVRKFIKAHYVGVGHQAMADLLNETFGTSYTKEQMKNFYSRFNLDSGLTGRFQKGLIPHNKGKKGISYPGMKATQFKEGNMPVNYRPVGSERISVDGYAEVKVADPRKWRLKHQVIWENANGPIPKKHVVIFGDGNRGNFDPDNLILLLQAQLVRMNQKHLIQNDAEMTRTGIIIADICNKIGERKRKRK